MSFRGIFRTRSGTPEPGRKAKKIYCGNLARRISMTKMSDEKPTRYFQNTANQILDILSKDQGREPNAWSDHLLAREVDVSVNLIQRVLAYLSARQLVARLDGGWQLTRPVRPDDYFDLGTSELSQSESVDSYCIQQLLSGRFRAGDRISELKLAREANVSTSSVREALLRISRFWIIEKNARRQWRVVEWDNEKIDHLMEWRLLVELHCLGKLIATRDADLRRNLEALLREHEILSQKEKPTPKEFLRLDESLHRMILSASRNSFLEDAFRTILFVIRFQFLHHAFDANFVHLGCRQHMQLLQAILDGEHSQAAAFLTEHIHTAGTTLKTLKVSSAE